MICWWIELIKKSVWVNLEVRKIGLHRIGKKINTPRPFRFRSKWVKTNAKIVLINRKKALVYRLAAVVGGGWGLPVGGGAILLDAVVGGGWGALRLDAVVGCPLQEAPVGGGRGAPVGGGALLLEAVVGGGWGALRLDAVVGGGWGLPVGGGAILLEAVVGGGCPLQEAPVGGGRGAPVGGGICR